MRQLICILFIGLEIMGSVNAQNVKRVQRLDGSYITADSIDALVNRLLLAAKVSGMGISVLNDNKPVYTKAFGYSHAGEKIKLDTNTVMYGASLSKAVFAFIVMHLVETKQFDLDKPLFTYFPNFTAIGDVYTNLMKDPLWMHITARMCLSHTTGMQNIWWMDPFTGARDTVTGVKLFFMPGTRYAYSNEGIKLLQKAVENATGTSLSQLADSLIFIPAGMHNTSYTWKPEYDKDSAWGHDENEKALDKRQSSRPNAAGSMVTTVADYSRFISYILQGKGLGKKYFKEMTTPQIRISSKQQFPTLRTDTTTENDAIQLSYGLGWGLLQSPYGKGFFKEGHDDHWRNYNINFLDKKIAIVLLSNSANGESIFKELLNTIIGDQYTPIVWENYTPYNAVPRN
ncbi:MAG: serine hydrolase domain-containing protein [Chitinophagaceae bacterium]